MTIITFFFFKCLRFLTYPPSIVLSQIYTRYGKCYTFNSGLDGNPLLTTLKGGTGNGLEIMLDIQQDEYLPVWGDTGKYQSPKQLHDKRRPFYRRFRFVYDNRSFAVNPICTCSNTSFL